MWETQEHHQKNENSLNHSTDVRNKTEMSAVHTLSQYYDQNASRHNKPWEGNKRVQIVKEIKLFFCTDDIILYIRNSKYSRRKLLEMINNSAMWQDTKLAWVNPWVFYTVTTNIQRKRLYTHPNLNSLKENQISTDNCARHHFHKFWVTITPAHYVSEVLCLSWCSCHTTGSLVWLEKMANFYSISSVMKSSH